MKSFKIKAYFSLILIFISIHGLMSCTPQEDFYAGGGIGGTGVISTGTVTEIGSVRVNGVEFDTRDADVYVNDALKGQGDGAVIESIHLGQVVRVNGTLNEDGSGRADAVCYHFTLSGPIRAMGLVGEHDLILDILGQKAIANDETKIQGATLDLLEIGNFINISGFIDDTGKIQASFIEKEADEADPEDLFHISGVVSDLNESDKTFFINAILVHYENAVLGGPLKKGLENGLWVHAAGPLESGDESLIAETINPFDRLEEDQTKKIEIEGVVGADLLENQFDMEGYLVEINSETTIENGTREEILSGSRIEAEGRFSGGILLADRIKFNSGFKIEAEVLEIDPANHTLILKGFEEITIETNDLTRFNGQAKSFEELGVEDRLMIRGRFVGENTLLAARIIKKS